MAIPTDGYNAYELEYQLNANGVNASVKVAVLPGIGIQDTEQIRDLVEDALDYLRIGIENQENTTTTLTRQYRGWCSDIIEHSS
jgi:ribosomal protein S13